MIMDAKTIAIGMRGPTNVGTHAGPARKLMARRATLNAGDSSHGCTRMNTDVFWIKTVSVFIRVPPWLKNAFCPVSVSSVSFRGENAFRSVSSSFVATVSPCRHEEP